MTYQVRRVACSGVRSAGWPTRAWTSRSGGCARCRSGAGRRASTGRRRAPCPDHHSHSVLRRGRSVWGGARPRHGPPCPARWAAPQDPPISLPVQLGEHGRARRPRALCHKGCPGRRAQHWERAAGRVIGEAEALAVAAGTPGCAVARGGVGVQDPFGADADHHLATMLGQTGSQSDRVVAGVEDEHRHVTVVGQEPAQALDLVEGGRCRVGRRL